MRFVMANACLTSLRACDREAQSSSGSASGRRPSERVWSFCTAHVLLADARSDSPIPMCGGGVTHTRHALSHVYCPWACELSLGPSVNVWAEWTRGKISDVGVAPCCCLLPSAPAAARHATRGCRRAGAGHSVPAQCRLGPEAAGPAAATHQIVRVAAKQKEPVAPFPFFLQAHTDARHRIFVPWPAGGTRCAAFGSPTAAFPT